MLPENSPTSRIVTRIYLIEEDGVISHQGQMTNVSKGDVKISLEVHGWIFSVDTHSPYAADNVSCESLYFCNFLTINRDIYLGV